MSGEVDSEISKKLLAVSGGVLSQCFSEVEGSLELSIIGIVGLISICDQIEITSSFV